MHSFSDDRVMPWISAALISVAAVWVLFRDTPGLLDVALIFSCILILVLLWPQLPSSTTEEFMVPTAVNIQEDSLWVQTLATKGTLTTYVSSFRTDSYPAPSDMWLSVADVMMGTDGGSASAASTAGITCVPASSSANRDFRFNEVQPVKDASLGFALSNVILTGPMSMVVLPPTFREYTAFMMFQLTGLPAAGTISTLLSIPANEIPKQNGLILTLSAVAGTGSGSSIQANVTVTVGNQPALSCSDNYVAGSSSNTTTVTFDTSARYLLTVSRSSLSIRVSLFNVEVTSALCIPNTIMTHAILDDALVYNNQSILINGSLDDLNGGGGIQGNIMTFGLFDAALSATDEALICTHYHTLLLNQNPSVQSALAAASVASAASAAAVALACPYDTATCAACSAVTSWTNSFSVVNGGGAACLAAINTFCTNNPTQVGCECYNPANIATFSVATQNACLALQSVYSGNSAAVCAGPVQTAIAQTQSSNKAMADSLAAAQADELRLRNQLAAEESVKTEPKPAKSFFAWLFGF